MRLDLWWTRLAIGWWWLIAVRRCKSTVVRCVHDCVL